MDLLQAWESMIHWALLVTCSSRLLSYTVQLAYHTVHLVRTLSKVQQSKVLITGGIFSVSPHIQEEEMLTVKEGQRFWLFVFV